MGALEWYWREELGGGFGSVVATFILRAHERKFCVFLLDIS